MSQDEAQKEPTSGNSSDNGISEQTKTSKSDKRLILIIIAIVSITLVLCSTSVIVLTKLQGIKKTLTVINDSFCEYKFIFKHY